MKICSVEGCEEIVRATGLCIKHYNQTDKVKQKQKEYSQSKKGKETHSKKQNKYRITEKGVVASQKYFKSEKGLEAQRKASHKRRLKIENVPSDSITNIDIFERDKWICCLCGERIYKNKKYPDLMCGTLEHLLPLSRGGMHTFDNVAAAHFSCNRKKYNKTMEEYRRENPLHE